MEKKDKVEKVLSASRIKNLESCYWSYWCKYHLKLPEKNNEGAMRGSICHLVFELVQLKKHKKHFKLIMKENRIEGSPAVTRLINKHLNAYGINNQENYEMINDMILVGLNDDFYCKGSKLLDPEYEFLMKSEDPPYQVRGFIDKAAQYTKTKEMLIKDYKSSKKKFEGDDITSNIQAMIYSLVAKKTWPKFKPFVEFCFLRFPKEPIQKVQFSDTELDGLEHYLSYVYNIINNFNEETAKSNYAADKPIPKKGFKGALNCGFAKYKGQLKKDGSPMWHCSFKFDFEYYAIVDEDGNVVKTAFEENELEPKDGEKIIKKKYDGCPRHQKNQPNEGEFGF